MDVSGLHVSFNFRTTYLGISNNFWCGFWVNGQLLHCFYWHIIKLSVGSSAFFASCTCLSTGRLSGGHKQTWCICDYIGLENFILGARKLRFFCESNLAHANTNNMCRNSWLSLNLPLNYGVNETISTNFAFFLFVLNVGTLNIAWAWNKLYNKHCGLFTIGLGSTLYWNVGELEKHVLVSHRLNQQWHLDVDWYVDTRNAHEPNIVLFLSNNLTIICVFFDFFTCWDLIHWWNLNVRNYWDHLKLIMTTYFYYADWVEIWRNLFGQELSSNSSSFCSSGTQNFHLLMYLYNYLFLTMKWNHKWGLGWKALLVHHQVNFPPFHKPKVPFVSTKGRTLGSYLFNFRLHLRWWHPTDRPTCRCHLLPKTSISETPHVSIFAADISGICSVYTAHMEDQVSPSWNKFVVLPHFGANGCVYTVITNGFSSCHRSCTIQTKSRGQRYPCHFLCQRSWVTCGKDIDQGRLIYVPAIVSTVDFLFLFMSCALFLRS